MHKATCDDCGKQCEVPFKPTGSKPIFCSDCFQNKGGGGRSGGRSDRRSDRRDRPMHKATCDQCGDRCEVPFKPSGDKPIFCDKCFGRGSGSSKGGCGCEKQLEMLDAKLEKILRLITPTTTIELKDKKVAKKKEEKKPKKATKKTATKKAVKKKTPAKKTAAKKTTTKKKAAAKKK